MLSSCEPVSLAPGWRSGCCSHSIPGGEAIFLVAGDKAGNWEGWYREMIPVAEARFAQHLVELESGEEGER
jgi:hypothetical protein